MTGPVPRDPAPALARGSGGRPRLRGRWALFAVAAVVALPLAQFARQDLSPENAVHDGALRVTRCTREWLGYLPAWRCTGSYEPSDPMTGDHPASDVRLAGDPEYQATGSLIYVVVSPDYRTVYSRSGILSRLLVLGVLAGLLLLVCAAVALLVASLTRGRSGAKAGTVAAAGSLILLLSAALFIAA